jgi:hypothetical protein
VVAADNPYAAITFQDPSAFCHPILGKLVITFEIWELIPIIVHGIDEGKIRPPEFLI